MAYISFLIFLTFRIFTAEQRQKRNPHFRFRQRLERTIHAMSKKEKHMQRWHIFDNSFCM